MSTMNLSQNGNTIVLNGGMTSDFNQMMRECAERFGCVFGDAVNVVNKLKERGSVKLTESQIMDLLRHGTKEEFYNNQNVWGYFCVDPNNYRNYTFSPVDSENRDNDYSRLRTGVANFSIEAGFDVYIIQCR